MPLHTTDALILRTYKLGESDRIVVFLTRDRGKKRGVAKNARQSRRRFGGALEPLTYGRVGYLERERRELDAKFVGDTDRRLRCGHATGVLSACNGQRNFFDWFLSGSGQDFRGVAAAYSTGCNEIALS
jgi:hypothetical protein